MFLSYSTKCNFTLPACLPWSVGRGGADDTDVQPIPHFHPATKVIISKLNSGWQKRSNKTKDWNKEKTHFETRLTHVIRWQELAKRIAAKHFHSHSHGAMCLPFHRVSSFTSNVGLLCVVDGHGRLRRKVTALVHFLYTASTFLKHCCLVYLLNKTRR